MTKVYSIRRLVKAYFIGWAIFVGTDFLLGRAAGGIFGIVAMPFYALYYTGKHFLFALLLGLFLGDDRINRFWFKDLAPFGILILVGISVFAYGIHSFYHAAYDLYNQTQAEYYRNYWMAPSFVLILFSLCYRPSEESSNLSETTIMETDEPTDDVTQTSPFTTYNYTCDEGELVIEQKGDIPSAEDKVYLNGQLAPSKKYQIGEKQFVMVSNGIVYAIRGFDNK